MSPRTARGNRLGIALAGLVLLAGGGYAIARAHGVLGDRQAREPLLTGAQSRWAAGHDWFWVAAAAVAVVLALLALRWLLVQFRVERLRRVSLQRDPVDGDTVLAADTVGDVVDDEILDLRGVVRVNARLGDDPVRPGLYVTVAAERGTDLGDLRRRLRDGPLRRVRQALEMPDLPVYLRLVTVRTSGGGGRGDRVAPVADLVPSRPPVPSTPQRRVL